MEEDSDSESQSQSSCLYKEKPKPNWFVIPELLRREIGNNPLFRRRYHGSLHVVEHFERMRKLEEHNVCTHCIEFQVRPTKILIIILFVGLRQCLKF